MSSPPAPERSPVAIRAVRTALAAHAQQDYAGAFRQLATVAATGDCEAQYQLGLLYARGQGVVPSIGDAVVWFRRAAEQGYAPAQYQLGTVCLHGGAAQGGADRWYASAAEIDKDTADRNFEVLFPNRIRVSPDQHEACHWCQAAADQALVEAQAALGFMYARGL